MVWVYATGGDNDIRLTDTYLPEFETLKAARPKYPKELVNKTFDFPSHEDALAWLLSARVRQRLSRRRMYYEDIRLETWVLGPPASDDAAFAAWFEDQGPTYRLLIHKTPNVCRSQYLPCHFRAVVYQSASRKQIGLRSRTGKSIQLKKAAKPVLYDLAHVYATRPNDVEKAIQRLGHPYWFSQGLPTHREEAR